MGIKGLFARKHKRNVENRLSVLENFVIRCDDYETFDYEKEQNKFEKEFRKVDKGIERYR